NRRSTGQTSSRARASSRQGCARRAGVDPGGLFGSRRRAPQHPAPEDALADAVRAFRERRRVGRGDPLRVRAGLAGRGSLHGGGGGRRFASRIAPAFLRDLDRRGGMERGPPGARVPRRRSTGDRTNRAGPLPPRSANLAGGGRTGDRARERSAGREHWVLTRRRTMDYFPSAEAMAADLDLELLLRAEVDRRMLTRKERLSQFAADATVA